MSGMLLQFMEGDILRRVVKEAWCTKNAVIRIPSVGTGFSEYNSATSVTLQGFVFEDGGAEITSRGIAWSAFFNPTVDQNSAIPETETGNFTVTLTGLTEGATYYARTYATNSAGTAYGNCISFLATSPAGLDNLELFTRSFAIYPNPASALTSFSFQLESSERILMTIRNIKGQVIYNHDLGSFPPGENQVRLDLKVLPDGLYTCQLTNGRIKVTRKLVIAH
jgi:hypothetical protein